MFVMENVPGLVAGKMKATFAEIMRALRAAGPGYRVVALLMSTDWFGVPQRRHRLVIIGARSDLRIAPEHPRARTRPLTVRDAFIGLPDPGLTPPMSDKIARLASLIEPGKDGKRALLKRGYRAVAFSLIRVRWDRPSAALTKTFYSAGSGYCGLLHPAENRHLGSRELTRLQSFPDEYDWGASTYTQIHNRLGNSVPPLFMRAVAETIADTLERGGLGHG
jgi:DNA (cytosine-5)-methyltransferase 1